MYSTHQILYEICSKKYNYIHDIIIQLNVLGFYTFTSQPGKISVCNNIERRQRAYIRGYMKKDMAMYITENMAHIPSVLIRSEMSNKVINSTVDCTCGSVEFKDGKPCTMDFNIGNYNQAYNFTIPLHRPFNTFITKEKHSAHFINQGVFDEYPGDLVEFDILDLRWNGENRIWNALLECILEYKLSILCE